MARVISAVLTLRDKFSSAMRRAADETGDFQRKIIVLEAQISRFDKRSVASFTAVGASMVALGAAAAPAIGAVGALGATFAAAGIGAVAFGAVAVSALGQVFEASDEVAKLEEKIASADTAKERIAAQKELAAVYAGMSKSQKGALQSLQQFKGFWSGFVKEFEDPVFDIFSKGLQATQTLLTGLKPTIHGVAGVFSGMMDSINQSMESEAGKEFFAWMAESAPRSLSALGQIFGNTFSGIFNIFKAFTPLSIGMENGLIGLTEKFKTWSEGLSQSQGFQNFVSYVQENGPVVWDIISNLAGIGKQLVTDLAPLGTTILSGLQSFTSLINDNWPLVKDTVIALGVGVGTTVAAIKGFQFISAVNTLMTAFKAGTIAQTIATWGLNAALWANPFTWVAIAIGGVIAVGVLLYRNWDTVKQAALDLWAQVETCFGQIGDWIMDKLSPVTDLFDSLVSKWDDFTSAISNFKMPSIGLPKFMGGDGLLQFDGSHATGLANVPFNGYAAQLHKGEAVLTASQAGALRNAGMLQENSNGTPTLDFSNRSAEGRGTTTTTTTTTNNTSGGNPVMINIYPQGMTANEVINELVPQLKLALGNM
jgi:hypothetical protein